MPDDCHLLFIVMKSKNLIIGHQGTPSTFKLSLMGAEGEQPHQDFKLKLPYPKQTHKPNKQNPPHKPQQPKKKSKKECCVQCKLILSMGKLIILTAMVT